jgi:hypothetical protein
MVVPFDTANLAWTEVPNDILWKIGFVVVFSQIFLTYLLNLLYERN